MTETLKNNLLTLIYFLIILVICFIVKWFWENILTKFLKGRELDTKILKRTGKGIVSFVFFSGISILWERTSLLIKTENLALTKFLSNLPKIIYSFIVLSIAFVISGIVDGFVEWYLEEVAKKTKTKIDEEFMGLFKRVSRIIIFFIAVTIILNKFNQPITSILGAAGIASFAIAFAAQDTLSNMISGFFIIIDKPFKIGDRIRLSTGEIGEVIEIGMRRTKILSPENNIVIVSNSEIAKTRIVNFGFPDTKIKIRLKIGIQNLKDKEKIKEILLEICKNNLYIIKDSYEVYLTEFSTTQTIFLLSFSVDYKYEMEVIDKIIEQINKKFEQEKFELIFVKKE
ncbi:MAG: mechanosensitive ion channel family protein [Candidatus Omnitrophica bacterium]|nr:mechanosensitive ion channel family protein [Candidatus Omnitrophota bacterium]MCM8802709.1 mechanosensitive ion channel family protein [Candidatus Omnitrophota bacterium]